MNDTNPLSGQIEEYKQTNKKHVSNHGTWELGFFLAQPTNPCNWRSSQAVFRFWSFNVVVFTVDFHSKYLPTVENTLISKNKSCNTLLIHNSHKQSSMRNRCNVVCIYHGSPLGNYGVAGWAQFSGTCPHHREGTLICSMHKHGMQFSSPEKRLISVFRIKLFCFRSAAKQGKHSTAMKMTTFSFYSTQYWP